jgi:hypothetical protein
MCDVGISSTAPAALSDDFIGDLLSVHGDATDDIVMEEPATRKRKKRSHSIKLNSSDSETDLNSSLECAVSKNLRGRPPKKSAAAKGGKKKAKKCGIKSSAIVKTCVDAETQTDASIEAVVSQSMDLNDRLLRCVKALLLPVSENVHSLQKELDDLKLAVTQLSSSITAMAQSHSIQHAGQRESTEANGTGGATEATADRGDRGDHSQGPDLGQSQQQSHPQSQSSSSGRVNRRTRRRDTDEFDTRRLKEDVMASMYIDMDQKQRRANNIVVTGIPYGDDFTTVTNLLAEEFDLRYIPTVSCRRIGRPVENRVQPLLVTLESRQDADYFIANARYLRESYDPAVRECVYISADLTPAESKAAYELRCRRRRNRDQNFQQQNPDQSTFTQGGRH